MKSKSLELNRGGRPRSQVKKTKQELEAELLAIKLAREEKKVFSAEKVIKVWRAVLFGLRQIVNQSNMPLTEKAELLKQLKEVPFEKYLE